MSLAPTSHNLYREFMQALSQSPNDSRTIWQTIVGHPWYQLELEKAAQHLVRCQNLQIFPEDIQHEAILFLARTLERHPDLQFDSLNPSQEHFRHLMRKIIFRDCQQALRRLRRGLREMPLTDACLATDFDSQSATPTNWDWNLKMLRPQERFVVDQYLQGRTFCETAALLEVSLPTV